MNCHSSLHAHIAKMKMIFNCFSFMVLNLSIILTTREIFLLITYWNDSHWWILMIFNKWWTLFLQCAFNQLTRINQTTQQNYLYYVLHDHPDSTIWVLVECYSQSLVIPMDPKGRLHLHLAWIHGKSSIIPFLLQYNPDAVQYHDNHNRLPLHHASNNLP